MLTRFAMTVWTSMIDARAYSSDFLRRRTGSALGYLYWLCVVLAFFGLLPFVIGIAMFAPSSRTLADTHLGVLRQWYPDDLEISISNGTLSTNKPEPVVFDLPPEWNNVRDENMPAHILVIDTAASIDDFASMDTVMLLTAKSIIVRGDNKTEIRDFGDVKEDVTINKQFVNGIVDNLATFTPALPWIAGCIVALSLLVFPWIVGGMLWLGTLFFLLWATLITWACSALMGRGLRYGELYRLGAFGVTSSMLASFVERMIGMSAPMLSSIVFYAWMIVVLSKFPKKTTPRAAVPLPPAAMATKKPASKQSQKTPKKAV